MKYKLKKARSTIGVQNSYEAIDMFGYKKTFTRSVKGFGSQNKRLAYALNFDHENVTNVHV